MRLDFEIRNFVVKKKEGFPVVLIFIPGFDGGLGIGLGLKRSISLVLFFHVGSGKVVDFGLEDLDCNHVKEKIIICLLLDFIQLLCHYKGRCNIIIYNITQIKKSRKMAHSGYDKDRFVNLDFDSFDCLICCEIVVEPLECEACGKLFCKTCINDWIRKNPTVKCPNRCISTIAPIKSMALKKMYNNLDIRCSNAKCQKVVKLFDLKNHEEICLKVKCWNFENCEKIQNQNIKSNKPCCSVLCQMLEKLDSNFGNHKKMYEILGEFGQTNKKTLSLSSNNENLCWDTSKFGTGIVISQSNSHVFLKEQPYVFRSVMGNIGFTQGVNYWEIIADPRTENQIKIGVTGSKQFDHNSAFCDHSFGFAYYGLGQLRHGSNATGPAYGKRFKKEGILGVCLNMEKGTLSFALNGDFMGIAYQDEKLKQGKYFPAVSLLHCAGCKIRGNMPVPPYFK